MKAKHFIFSTILALSIASCSYTVENDSAQEVETVETTKVAVVANDAVDMKVEGMVCVNGCKGAIEKSLNSMAGIESCDIDFEEGIAHVSFDNQLISDTEIQKAIENVNDGAYTAEFIVEEKTTEEVPAEETNTAS